MHLSQKILGKYVRRIRSSSDKLALKPSIKSQLFSKWFMGSSISSKKRTNEFNLTIMIPQVDLFSFVFWRKSTTPETISKLSDL